MAQFQNKTIFYLFFYFAILLLIIDENLFCDYGTYHKQIFFKKCTISYTYLIFMYDYPEELRHHLYSFRRFNLFHNLQFYYFGTCLPI